MSGAGAGAGAGAAAEGLGGVSALLRRSRRLPLPGVGRPTAREGRRPALTGVGLLALVAIFAVAPFALGPRRDVYRPELRAYHGAPPRIPHAVRALGREDCTSCHAAPDARARGPLRLPDGSVAIAVPHTFTGASCLQCHVEQTDEAPLVPSRFVGAADPAPRERAYDGAPPVIPHGIFARTLCLSCHGEGAYAAIATPHPDRVNCRQCHVTADDGARSYADNGFGAQGGAALPAAPGRR